MPPGADLKRLSKFLALLLRHKADTFGLTLDAAGFVDVNQVWAQVQQRYPGQYTPDDLTRLLDSAAGKARYELHDGRIRALYGHSAVTDIEYPPVEPPEILYHGTTAAALPAIRAEGLTAQKRQYVHFATVIDRALNVAGRHSRETVLLVIRAREAYAAGISFYQPEPLHFLAKAVPPEFIDFPDDGG